MDTAVRSELASEPVVEQAAVAAWPVTVRWLGRIDYRAAWALQRELVEARVAGTVEDQLLLLEHPAVLTLGRHADEGYVRASSAELARRGIELIRVERGGEVTYHGPGQLVAYPILALSRRGLLVRPLVRYLEFSARQSKDDLIVVILPEYVARHRWERLLFNENARRIRDELLGHPNILVAQVPFRRDL